MITYKYYNRKRQRLAIQARPFEQFIEVQSLVCSRKDAFNKKIAREVLNLSTGEPVVYNGVTYHPDRILLDNAGNWQKEVFEYLNRSYYKREVAVASKDVEILIKGEDFIALKPGDL